MTYRPTPLTDQAAGDLTGIELCAAFEIQSRRMELRCYDLERKLAEADQEVAGWKKLGGNLQDCEETLKRIDAKLDKVAEVMREKDRQIAEAREALQWAQGELGKHTRPSPIDKALARIDAKGKETA